VVAVLFTIAIVGLVRPLVQDIRRQGGLTRMAASFGAPTFRPEQLFTGFMLLAVAALTAVATQWDFSAKIVPLVVGSIALTVLGLSLFNETCRKPRALPAEGVAEQAEHDVHARMHMDITSDTAHLGVRTIAQRAGIFFGYLIAFMAVMAVIGLIPTAGLFVIAFMRLEGAERWSLVVPYAVCLVLGIYLVFEVVMSIPWPPTLLGTWFPALKLIPSM
jgi:hypothetical protein